LGNLLKYREKLKFLQPFVRKKKPRPEGLGLNSQAELVELEVESELQSKTAQRKVALVEGEFSLGG
jgi:hypothetical protein